MDFVVPEQAGGNKVQGFSLAPTSIIAEERSTQDITH